MDSWQLLQKIKSIIHMWWGAKRKGAVHIGLFSSSCGCGSVPTGKLNSATSMEGGRKVNSLDGKLAHSASPFCAWTACSCCGKSNQSSNVDASGRRSTDASPCGLLVFMICCGGVATGQSKTDHDVPGKSSRNLILCGLLASMICCKGVRHSLEPSCCHGS